MESKHPEKPLLLSQIKKEKLVHSEIIELRLDYKIKGEIKTESQLIDLKGI